MLTEDIKDAIKLLLLAALLPLFTVRCTGDIRTGDSNKEKEKEKENTEKVIYAHLLNINQINTYHVTNT